jgi:hypothetical protein
MKRTPSRSTSRSAPKAKCASSRKAKPASKTKPAPRRKTRGASTSRAGERSPRQALRLIAERACTGALDSTIRTPERERILEELGEHLGRCNLAVLRDVLSPLLHFAEGAADDTGAMRRAYEAFPGINRNDRLDSEREALLCIETQLLELTPTAILISYLPCFGRFADPPTVENLGQVLRLSGTEGDRRA